MPTVDAPAVVATALTRALPPGCIRAADGRTRVRLGQAALVQDAVGWGSQAVILTPKATLKFMEVTATKAYTAA